MVTSLSRERVIVTEFVDGAGFEELKKRPRSERDRVGEIVFRFYFGCLYRHHQFSGDPHPGNSMLLDDGRMAFLDFGLFKRMPPGTVELEIAVARAVIEGDTETMHADRRRDGLLPRAREVRPRARARAFPRRHLVVHDGRGIELTPEYRDPGADRHESTRARATSARCATRHAPPDHIFGRRMEVLTLAVLSQLHARGNFHRIAREWFYGDEPATELGSEEAEFYGQRGDAQVKTSR